MLFNLDLFSEIFMLSLNVIFFGEVIVAAVYFDDEHMADALSEVQKAMDILASVGKNANDNISPSIAKSPILLARKSYLSTVMAAIGTTSAIADNLQQTINTYAEQEDNNATGLTIEHNNSNSRGK